MKVTTAAELAKNLNQVLDELESKGEEIIVERNHQEVARLVPGPTYLSALEAMSDLYKTLPVGTAAGW